MAEERPQDVVAHGYDVGADAFADWQRQITGSRHVERVNELLALLPERSDVLELGSGAGVQATRVLAERANLVGVDISAEQVRRATNRISPWGLVRAGGLEIVCNELETIREPEGEATFLWVLARTPA